MSTYSKRLEKEVNEIIEGVEGNATTPDSPPTADVNGVVDTACMYKEEDQVVVYASFGIPAVNL